MKKNTRKRIRLEGRPGTYFERQRAFIEHVLPTAKGSAVRVWTALQGFAGRDRGADTDGIVWPGIQKIAATIGGTLATVYAGIRELEDAGVLRTVEEGTPRRSARRQLLVHTDHEAGFQESEPCLSENGIQGSENRNSRLLKTGTELPSTTDLSETTTPTSTAHGGGRSLRSSEGGGGNGEASASFETREEKKRAARAAPRAQLETTDDAREWAAELYETLTSLVGASRSRKTLLRLIEKDVVERGGERTTALIHLRQFQDKQPDTERPIGVGGAVDYLKGKIKLNFPPSLHAALFGDGDDADAEEDDTDPRYWKDLDYPPELAEELAAEASAERRARTRREPN